MSIRPTHTLAAIAAFSAFAIAQDAGGLPTTPQAEPTAKGRFGVDFTSQYFFRGIRQETQDLIAQPWAEVKYALIDGNDDLRSLDLTFGTWHSLHGGPSGGGFGVWYEGRGYVDLAAAVGEKWTFGVRYTAYGNPNDADAFENVQEFAFRGQLDDRGFLGDLIEGGLQPYAMIAFETDGEREQYAPGNTADANNGIYGEVGINPSFNTGIGDDDLRLYVPVKLGFSVSDYYQDSRTGKDEKFGYLDVGVEVRQPLKFLPGRMGPWDAVVGLHWLLLGDNCEERNTGVSGAPGDEMEFVLNIGLSTRF